MSSRTAILALTGVVVASVLITIFVVDMSSSHPHPFVHTGPSPEERSVQSALVTLGGSPTSFDCAAYRTALGDELEAKQEARLCDEGASILEGPISTCICGAGPPEVTDEEDPLVYTALEDLGYECETKMVPGVGNVTERVGAFNATACRARLCEDDSCNDLVALQARLCDKSGDPRYSSNVAECVCLNAPPPPPIMCSPGQTLPVVWNETLSGLLTLTQTNMSLTINVTTEDLCFQQPRVYIGATRAPRTPQFPHLPGQFPTDSWEQEIGVVGGDGPVQFSLADLNQFPPAWNHPGAPTFECGHELYLEWAALAAPRLENGHCPSVMHTEGWLPVSSDPAAFTYTFCCV